MIKKLLEFKKLLKNKMIAILVPVCSRNQNYKDINDIPFIKNLYPSIQKTGDKEYNYHYFIGYDNDDIFYIHHKNYFQDKDNISLIELEGCQNAPAHAWNILFQKAIESDKNFEYFFQIGDDVILSTEGWTQKFIKILEANKGIGTVGPCEPINYNQRVGSLKPPVIENNFVTRKHHQIFGYFFHPGIKNWFCDDWITQVYGEKAVMDLSIIVENNIRDNRYQIIVSNEIPRFIFEGYEKVKKFIYEIKDNTDSDN
jgi:hypothetical protein